MEDQKIIELYWARLEEAIQETSLKYGKLCQYIANNILSNLEDSEECVNDTYLSLWTAIPPEKPRYFAAFIGRITRNLALKRYEYLSAAKRNPQAICSLDELGQCVSGSDYIESELENKRIEAAINRFLWQQDPEKRNVFILRYWYFASIANICQRTGFSQSKVKSMLYQLRRKLQIYLESEDIAL